MTWILHEKGLQVYNAHPVKLSSKPDMEMVRTHANGKTETKGDK
jgi:hypothetical protein